MNQDRHNPITTYLNECETERLDQGWVDEHSLGLGCKTVDLRNVRLLVMLGVGYLTIEVISVDELEDCCEYGSAALVHHFNVIPVPQYQSLHQEKARVRRHNDLTYQGCEVVAMECYGAPTKLESSRSA